MRVDLDLVEARWRIGLIMRNDLHAVAGELLDDGISADALIELFALPIDAVFWRGAPLFERALTDLGGGRMTEEEAAQALARDLARRVLSGTLPPAEGTSLAASIHVRTGYRFDCFHELYVLDDEMTSIDRSGRSYLGRTEADVAEDVRIEARRIHDEG